MVTDHTAKQSVGTVECRYCLNLDHWVPNAKVVIEIACRHCAFCPMVVLEHDWVAHKGHNGVVDAPLIVCLECPDCGGPILPEAKIAECRPCDLCDAYIPLANWDGHLRDGCHNADNPFS